MTANRGSGTVGALAVTAYLDYLIKIESMPFRQAVEAAAGTSLEPASHIKLSQNEI
jgi:hypothetical protein